MFLVVIGLLMLSTFASAQVADKRVAKLAKGVNISHWFAQAANYDPDRLKTYFNETDVALVKQMGFSHVRLTVDASMMFDADKSGVVSPRFAELMQRLPWFLDAGIAVIVDLHPSTAYKKSLSDAKAADQFVAGWGAVATVLQATDPDNVFIEIMNEPDPMGDQAWRDLQERAVKAIRAKAPQHTIIVNPGRWTSSADLIKFKPYEIDNLIYTFHFYDPHLYTHQSATWGWNVWTRVKGLDWPIDAGEAEKVASAATTDAEAHKVIVQQVSQGQFTREAMSEKFDKLAAWQKANNNVPIYLGEFGAYSKSSTPEARYRYYQAVREEAEKHHIGWCIWDYTGSFGIAVGKAGARTADPLMLKALGLP